MAQTMRTPSLERDADNLVAQQHFNTITEPTWKASSTSSMIDIHPAERLNKSTRNEARPITMIQEEGFPFHAQVGLTGENPTNAILETEQPTNTNEDRDTGGQENGRGVDDGRPVPKETSSRGTTGRPMVQFASATEDEYPGPALQPRNVNPSTTDRPAHFRSSSLMNRILALSPSGHRNQMGFTNGNASTVDSSASQIESIPQLDQAHESGHSITEANDGEIDADAEDSAIDDRSARLHEKSIIRRRKQGVNSNNIGEASPRNRTLFPIKRAATETAAGDHHRQGVSEDEGRERIARNAGWRRRSSAWLHSAQQQSSPSVPGVTRRDSAEAVRPSNRRFFSNLAGNSSLADGSPSLRRARTENRAQDAWNKIRNSMKLIVQKSNKEIIDQAKSAELMAELLAGSPAALILASHFQRDERDKKRIPVLLEQIKISIPSSSPIKEDSSADRHLQFHIELEYGSGLMRMKWTIDRTLRDFMNLHLKYKLQSGTQKYIQRNAPEETARNRLPRFPRSAFPILRGVRAFSDDEEEEEEEIAEEGEASDGQLNGGERPLRLIKRTSTFRPQRQRSNTVDHDNSGIANGMTQVSDAVQAAESKKENFNARQRKKLETYLRELIRFVIFRPGSNRLCRFLEMSALGVRLASEASYHGKEGTLVLQSGKGIDFRKAWRPSLLIQRHRPMWFLVRHSYLVCIDSPEAMNIYDVFLVDSGFDIQARRPRLRDQKNVHDFTKTASTQARHPQHHVLRLQNNERKIRLLAKNERQLQQFEDSLRLIQRTTPWARKHRFDSFAPVRNNVFAQWLVDGRDYMWNVSRAISMAQDVIYIHDWWLSPEIYMRRPAAISHKWRLDRLLQRKAEEGVKIFIIVYRNINSAIPIDSEYTKFSMLDLHPNVFVQRSPNQFRQNTFFWAHHEKLCIVDHTLAFCGGVDLCFGRWDTPQHTVVDDKHTGFEPSAVPLDADHCQLWPGKDYSNPRVLDFFKLDEPYGEMYDRGKVPRMPWHDIGMQIVGQPARDLTRHFVQRWNYILRQRKPSRPTPFLLPPPDFAPKELETLGLDGTCEIQMLRSACDWSIGTPSKIEHSIMNAYVKLIQTSDHFIYIENQFFITSCMVEGTKIRNAIGDAIVQRVIRAHAAREKWRAIIVIPLMPGFQNTVDAQDGSSIRLIMQCQYRSIDRGDTSIFERLRAVGIQPEEYIEFYSLRSWGKIGSSKALVTEQLYIHAKVMVVDDRYAIIGSANINERSLLGERDSEIAAVISDSDMIDSFMAGKRYKVGRFPHTLRMRLMREHLGIDVDAVMDEEREAQLYRQVSLSDDEEDIKSTSSRENRSTERKLMESKHRMQDDLIAKSNEMHTFNHDIDWEQADNPHLKTNKKLTADPRVTANQEHRADVEGHGSDNMAIQKGRPASRGRDTVMLKHDREVLVNNLSAEGKGTLGKPVDSKSSHQRKHSKSSSKRDDYSANTVAVFPPTHLPRLNTLELGLTQVSQLPSLPQVDDTDIGGPPLQRALSVTSAEVFNPLLASMRRPVVDKDCMRDPLNDSFFYDTWHTVAANNTKLFRQVFRCMPDSQVTNWREYEMANAYAERFAHSQGMPKSNAKMQQESHGTTGPPGHNTSTMAQPIAAFKSKVENASTTANDDQRGLGEKIKTALEERRNRDDTLADRTGSKDNDDEEKRAILDADYEMHEREHANSVENAQSHIDFTAVPNKGIPEQKSTTNEKPTMANGDVEQPEHQYGGSRRRRRGTTRSTGPNFGPDYMPSKADAEELLKLVQGHLIEWPYDWLLQEERGGKWLYSVDQMAPLEIYN